MNRQIGFYGSHINNKWYTEDNTYLYPGVLGTEYGVLVDRRRQVGRCSGRNLGNTFCTAGRRYRTWTSKLQVQNKGDGLGRKS